MKVRLVFGFTWYHWKFTICLCINYANSTDQSNESRMQLLGFEPTTYLIHVNALPNGLVCDPNTLYQTYIGWCSSVFFISRYFCNTEGRWAFITSKQWVAKTITIYLFFNWSYTYSHIVHEQFINNLKKHFFKKSIVPVNSLED